MKLNVEKETLCRSCTQAIRMTVGFDLANQQEIVLCKAIAGADDYTAAGPKRVPKEVAECSLYKNKFLNDYDDAMQKLPRAISLRLQQENGLVRLYYLENGDPNFFSSSKWKPVTEVEEQS
jgi:hypothetical protein